MGNIACRWQSADSDPLKHSSQTGRFKLDTRQGKLAGLFAASNGCGGFSEFLGD